MFNGTNEALCIQKAEADNPIAGIFLNVTPDVGRTRRMNLGITAISQEMREIFAEENAARRKEGRSELKLYLYDRRQKEDIVRVVENESEILDILSNPKSLTGEVVRQYQPYKGFRTSEISISTDPTTRPFSARGKGLDLTTKQMKSIPEGR